MFATLTAAPPRPSLLDALLLFAAALMVKVKLLVGRVGDDFADSPGDVVEMTTEEATRAIADRQAELAPDDAKVTRKSPPPKSAPDGRGDEGEGGTPDGGEGQGEGDGTKKRPAKKTGKKPKPAPEPEPEEPESEPADVEESEEADADVDVEETEVPEGDVEEPEADDAAAALEALGIPARAIPFLVEAGLTTAEAIKAHTDLTELDGIGPTLAEAILTAVA